nr:immunoglobulin light chain junction region [Macaca mulatta]MOX90402.1 immunoglobulin light chain junction region [Macaca mulatta]
CQHSDSWNSF